MATKSSPQNSPVYHLEMKMNDKVFECDTDNLAEAIMSFQPQVLKTRVFFNITKNGLTCAKQVMVRRARMMFRNPMYMNAFMRQLIFKTNG